MRSFTALAAALTIGAAVSGGTARAQTVQLTFVQPLSAQGTELVQQRLRQAGDYPGAIDGQWGPDSVVALQRFQQMHGLQPTGQMNQATTAALGLDPNSLIGAPIVATAPPSYAPPAAPSFSPRAVEAVQGRLRALGYYRGNIDGVWGAQTQQAIARFQQGRGLQPNGQLNPATVEAMGLSQGWLFAQG